MTINKTIIEDMKKGKVDRCPVCAGKKSGKFTCAKKQCQDQREEVKKLLSEPQAAEPQTAKEGEVKEINNLEKDDWEKSLLLIGRALKRYKRSEDLPSVGELITAIKKEVFPKFTFHLIRKLANTSLDYREMGILAENGTFPGDLGIKRDKRAFIVAKRISKDNKGIFGKEFKMLISAVATRLEELEKLPVSGPERRADVGNRELAEKVSKTRARIDDADRLKEEREKAKREEAEVAAKIASEKKRKEKEILDRPRVPLWTLNGHELFGFQLEDKSEVQFLRGSPIVILNSKVYGVNRELLDDGKEKIYLKLLGLGQTNPQDEKPAVEEDTSKTVPESVGDLYVVADWQEKASGAKPIEAIKAVILKKEQFNDDDILLLLPVGTYVVEDGNLEAEMKLKEIWEEHWMWAGTCRKANDLEKALGKRALKLQLKKATAISAFNAPRGLEFLSRKA
ncbi:MAG: hypothetical protein ABIG60_03155 [Patescibacteria group bacterium]